MTPSSIETISGQFVDLVDPRPDTIFVRDIAWALSRIPRYVGHTVGQYPYSVGQHSIFLTTLVRMLFRPNCHPSLKASLFEFTERSSGLPVNERHRVVDALERPVDVRLLLELLMHDASEAYIVDVPSPLKEVPEFRQVYMKFEERMMAAIRLRFNMGEMDPIHEVFVKWADRVALAFESHHLMISRGKNWTRPLHVDISLLTEFPAVKQPIDVYEDFLRLFDEFTVYP